MPRISVVSHDTLDLHVYLVHSSEVSVSGFRGRDCYLSSLYLRNYSVVNYA